MKKLQHYREVSVLVHPFVPWDVEIRPCTSDSSIECRQRASCPTELQFPPSITSISKSLFSNSRALAKSFSSVVLRVRLSCQICLTGRKPLDAVKFPVVTLDIMLNSFAENLSRATFFLTSLKQKVQPSLVFQQLLNPT